MESIIAPTHGARPRPSRPNGRKRKGASDYAAENRDDFTFKSILRHGQLVNVLVCKFCSVIIGARSDRIKEHLASKRHTRLKLEHALRNEREENVTNSLYNEVAEFATDLSRNHFDTAMESEESLSESVKNNMLSMDSQLSSMNQDFHASQAQGVYNASVGGIVIPDATMSRFMNLSSVERTRPPPRRRPNFRQPSQQSQAKEMKYCVQWTQYASILKNMFTYFQINGDFTDVTVTSDRTSIKCHKVVLAACSDYFFELLKDNPCQHPIIILKDTPFWELQAIMEFMYHGEVHVRQDQLHSLLKTADQLGVRGLTATSIASPPHIANASLGSNPGPLFGSNLMPGQSTTMNIPTVEFKTNDKITETSNEKSNVTPKPYPYFGFTSGGICHEPFSTLSENDQMNANNLTGIQFPPSISVTRTDPQTHRTSSLPTMFENAPQQQGMKKRKIYRKCEASSEPEPPITIRKLTLSGSFNDAPGITMNEESSNCSIISNDTSCSAISWKTSVPKIEIKSEFCEGQDEDD